MYSTIVPSLLWVPRRRPISNLSDLRRCSLNRNEPTTSAQTVPNMYTIGSPTIPIRENEEYNPFSLWTYTNSVLCATFGLLTGAVFLTLRLDCIKIPRWANGLRPVIAAPTCWVEFYPLPMLWCLGTIGVLVGTQPDSNQDGLTEKTAKRGLTRSSRLQKYLMLRKEAEDRYKLLYWYLSTVHFIFCIYNFNLWLSQM